MPGYSGTPLPRKLGIKEKFRLAFFALPADVAAELQDAIAECVVWHDESALKRGPFDFVHVFVKSQSELKKRFLQFSRCLQPAGMVWVSWPKKSSGVVTDVDENDVRRIGLAAGLVDVKVCSVTEVWSGLKFVIRVKDRAMTSSGRADRKMAIRGAGPRGAQ